ncbi:MAG TPA: hypothetical protein VF699_11120 [Caulobacteraceae bacterium]|jgi:hypothetical protein
MLKAAEYRAKAELAEREAAQMSLREHREQLLEIARHWRLMAEHREALLLAEPSRSPPE